MQLGKQIGAVLWVILLLLTGCGGRQESPASQEPDPGQASEQIKTIGSLGPANTEILIGLGLRDQIILADTWSGDVEGLNPEVTYTDMMTPDVEQIVQLSPDVVFVTGMTLTGGDDPYKSVSDAGIRVIYMAASESITGIFEDIRFLAEVTNRKSQGEELIAAMEDEIGRIQGITDQIPEDTRRTVYFEIEPSPHIVSFGRNVFLDEFLALAGGVNILSQYTGYITINDEVVLAANPDVILTSVDYIEDPVGDITGRAGWEAITAVQKGRVYAVDTNSTNRASHHVVSALREIGQLIYPEYYES